MSSTRYRRSFDWRISTGDPQEVRKVSEAFAALSGNGLADVLEDFLEISRKRRQNPLALAKLQLQLLDEVVHAEQALKYYKNKREELETTAAGSPPDETQKTISKDIEVIDRELFFHKAYLNCIRAIGDGIAWRALGYDRAALRALCQNPSKPIVVAEGTITELREWSQAFDKGRGIAILNSLTNCLTTGDVTVVEKGGSVEIVEVKNRKSKSRRLTRQKQKMREIVKLLSSGQGEIEETRVDVLRFGIFPENGLLEVRALLEQAERLGWASRRVSNFLYVECFDVRAISDTKGVLAELAASADSGMKDWAASGDFVVTIGSPDIIAFTPNCAPLSVFPFTSRTCVELLTQAKSYRTHLNISAVTREFSRMGWVVEKTLQELVDERGTLDEGVLAVRKGRFHTTVPPAHFMRLQAETLRPKVLVKEMEMMEGMGPDANLSNALVVYEGESQIWD